MKLGVVLPVGPLDRFGYQYNCDVVVREHCAFADKVFMCSSTRNRSRIDDLLAEHENLVYVANEETWLDLDEQGNETFAINRTTQRTNHGLLQCREAGMDCAVIIHINQYAPHANHTPLRSRCEALVESGDPFAWLYKRYMLGETLYHADRRLPWIFNLRVEQSHRMSNDSVIEIATDKRTMIEAGDFREHNGHALVDFPMELTRDDLLAVREFINHYQDIRPASKEWQEIDGMIQKYAKKFAHKVPSREPLDEVGREVIHNRAPNSVSEELLALIKKDHAGQGIIGRVLRRMKKMTGE